MVAGRVAYEAERVERGYRLLEEHGSFSKAGEIFMADLSRVVDEVMAGAGRWRTAANKSGVLDPIWPTVV